MARIGIALVLLILPWYAAGETPVPPAHPLAPFIHAQLAQVVVEPRAVPDGPRLAVGDGVVRFYAVRAYAPAWEDPARFAALLAALAGVADDGLRPQDYLVDILPTLRAAAGPSAALRAQADVLATHALLEALAHVHGGKVDPDRAQPVWRFEARPTTPAAWMGAIQRAVEDGDLAGLFDRARPPHPLYRALREGLRSLRRVAAAGGWPVVASGPALEPGMTDPRVPALRQRLAAGAYLPAPASSDAFYDGALAEAVMRFQHEQYLKPDGVVGPATLGALNVPVEARIEQLRANLERARWMLRELRGDLVLVDIAGYRIVYFRGSRPIWRSRVQVGRPYRSTPAFRSEITYFTFNPTWTLPPTIMREDVLPKVRDDIGHLARNRMRALDRASGAELDPALVDWSDPAGVLLRQDAGPGNALGQVAIRFPNPHAVYLHDTPDKRLFERGQRAFSSGCIRVENPLELVELLFDDPERWSRPAIERLIASGRTRDVPLPRPVPILLLYWTVDVHADGRIAFKPDIYGRDAPLLQALSADRP